MAHALGNPHLTTKSHRHPSFQLRSKCGVLPMFISATSCKYLLRRISENKHTHTHSTYTLYIYIYLYIYNTYINYPDPSFVIMDHIGSWIPMLSSHRLRRGAFDSLISDLHASNLERRARSSITRESRVPGHKKKAPTGGGWRGHPPRKPIG